MKKCGLKYNITHISIRPLYYVNKSSAHSLVGFSLQIALAQSLTHREYNKCYLNRRKMISKVRSPVVQCGFLLQTRLQAKAFLSLCFHKGLLPDGAGWCQGLALTLGTSIYNKHLMSKCCIHSSYGASSHYWRGKVYHWWYSNHQAQNGTLCQDWDSQF